MRRRATTVAIEGARQAAWRIAGSLRTSVGGNRFDEAAAPVTGVETVPRQLPKMCGANETAPCPCESPMMTNPFRSRER